MISINIQHLTIAVFFQNIQVTGGNIENVLRLNIFSLLQQKMQKCILEISNRKIA